MRTRWTSRIVRGSVFTLLLLLSVAAATAQPAPAVKLVEVARGLSSPVYVTWMPGRESGIVVVEKTGTVRFVENGAPSSTAILDLRGQVSGRSEQGLLSVAFHPRFAENGYMYVNYTDPRGDTQIARYTVNLDTYRADVASRKQILSLAQPASNHNGGMMAFGPDGYLYISTGDGGGANDPWGYPQSFASLLGKILRIDVDVDDAYAIPSDNPFVERASSRPEIWAMGLRNPWRFSFDRENGDLYIADVGQGAWEEVNYQPAESKGGENYGWSRMEGAHCFPLGSDCDPAGYTLPVHEYRHSNQNGCSITGGYVYRGRAISDLVGWYVFGDYCAGRIWAMDTQTIKGEAPTVVDLAKAAIQISSFGEDFYGEHYVADLGSGRILKLVSE